MAISTYDESLRRLLAHEGGYTNHPSDPGGPTNYGITIADYRRYVKPDATAADVRAMNIAEAKAIYRAKYWDALRCDELPAGVDYCLFDYAVNSGTGRAPKVLQRVLEITVSGRMDDATVRSAGARGAAALIAAICGERLRFLQSLKTWPVFGAGWGRRVAEARAAALAMAARAKTGAVRADETLPPPAAGKGAIAVNVGAQKGTAGSVIASGAVAAQQAHQSGARPLAIAIVVAAALALALGGWLFWHWRQQRQQERPA